MRGVKHITSGLILVAVTLCFCLAVSTVWAAGGDGHAAADAGSHAVEAAHGAADAHGDAHGDGHHSSSLSSEKLWDLFFRVLNFAVLVLILVKFGAKPVAEGLSARQKKIKDEIEDLETRRDDAKTSYEEFEAKLAGMEKEIDTIVDKAVSQAEVEKAKIIEKAEKAADDIKRQAEMAVQNEIMDARRTLKNDMADQASTMAEELIKKNLTSDDQVKIIEDYLDKVGAVQ